MAYQEEYWQNFYEKAWATRAKFMDECLKNGLNSYQAVKGGKFVGLPLDADNESEKTEPRISAWIEQIKPHFA